MVKPNFFIIGAPKCGTTSLAMYLEEHADVFMSKPKEPHYFLTDLPEYRQVKDYESYRALFDCNHKDFKIRGEGSTWYLFSKEAVQNIVNFNPKAKIIVMLRRPDVVAESLYHQFIYGHEEDASSFEDAWNLQELRNSGRSIPLGIVEPARLQYRDVCALGTQLERVMEAVPDKQLKVILFDDFTSNTRKVYLDVLHFLELEADSKEAFPVMNMRKGHKIKFLAKLTRQNKNFDKIVARVKSLIGIKNVGLSDLINKLNRKDIQNKNELDLEFKNLLVTEFEDEIAKIEDLLSVNLDHWRKVPESK